MKRSTCLLVVALFLFGFGSQAAGDGKNHNQKEKWDIAKIQKIFLTRPPWVNDFWTREEDDVDITGSTCVNLIYFYEFYSAFTAVIQRDDLHWKDIEFMSADIALHVLSEHSSYVAKMLVKVFDMPNDLRKNAVPCLPMIARWDDGITIASIVLDVLTSGFNSPLSISLTKTELKKKMIHDIKLKIVELANRASQNPTEVPIFKEYLIRAVKTCKFSSRDLTDSEHNQWGSILQSLPGEFWASE